MIESTLPPGAKPAPAKVNAELAVCPGQTFSQPFETFKDSNYYTLVEGSEFNESRSFSQDLHIHIIDITNKRSHFTYFFIVFQIL